MRILVVLLILIGVVLTTPLAAQNSQDRPRKDEVFNYFEGTIISVKFPRGGWTYNLDIKLCPGGKGVTYGPYYMKGTRRHMTEGESSYQEIGRWGAEIWPVGGTEEACIHFDPEQALPAAGAKEVYWKIIRINDNELDIPGYNMRYQGQANCNLEMNITIF